MASSQNGFASAVDFIDESPGNIVFIQALGDALDRADKAPTIIPSAKPIITPESIRVATKSGINNAPLAKQKNFPEILDGSNINIFSDPEKTSGGSTGGGFNFNDIGKVVDFFGSSDTGGGFDFGSEAEPNAFSMEGGEIGGSDEGGGFGEFFGGLFGGSSSGAGASSSSGTAFEPGATGIFADSGAGAGSSGSGSGGGGASWMAWVYAGLKSQQLGDYYFKDEDSDEPYNTTGNKIMDGFAPTAIPNIKEGNWGNLAFQALGLPMVGSWLFPRKTEETEGSSVLNFMGDDLGQF